MIKNVTLSAEEQLIAQARRRAQQERKTLNAVFREWLAAYVGKAGAVEKTVKARSEVSSARMNSVPSLQMAADL